MRKSPYRRTVLRSGLMLLLSTVILLPTLVWGSTGIVIMLRSEAMVEDQEILLGDLSDIQPAHDPHVAKLLKIKIANAPLPGQTKWIRPEEIKLRIKQFGLDENGYTLRETASVKVSRRAAVFELSQFNFIV